MTLMPSRVVQHHTRGESPPSESEKSFVSAASENTSDWSSKDSRVGQSAAAALPSPPRHSAFGPAHSTAISTPQVSNNNHDLSAGLQALSPSSSTSPTPLAPQLGSYFTQQPGALGNEARSPQNRRPRPPASRSSHGIETSSGPPPALSTRRSYNAESPWRNPPSSDPYAVHPPMVHSASIDSIVRQTHHPANEHIDPNISEGARSARPRTSSVVDSGSIAMNGRYDVQSGSEEDRDSTLRINGYNAKNRKHIRKESGQKQSQSSHEDLFLNLARADSVVDDRPEPSNDGERKNSRIRGSSLQQPRESQPSLSHRPSTSVGGFGQQALPMHSLHHEPSFNPSYLHSPEKNSLSSSKDSPAKGRSYAASAHPLDQRYRAGNTRTSFGGLTRDGQTQDQLPELPLGSGRRQSIREPSPRLKGLGYKQSDPSYAPNGNYESSYFSGHRDQAGEAEEDPQTPHIEGTESTVSTTAPSTVWDELEDMKSRIRKLEITGVLPASSSAAMSNTFRDRPPTATTTMTTNSLSPKRRHMKSVSPQASTVKAPEVANVHPHLHAALAKTKSAIHENLYNPLEATATDALTLAAMVGSASAQDVSPSTASMAGISSAIDRQLRRKADNMCRSLTELCIALAEESPETGTVVGNIQPESKFANTAVKRNEPALEDLRSFRATSDEPELRSSSRVMSRLEARRTSLALGSSPLSRRESLQEAPTPTQTVPPASSRLDRTSSVVHRASEDQGDTTNSRRPPSRATTEIGQIKYSPQTRTSREYTSQHPMPNHSQRSPSIQSSLPTRKSYFSSASQSPLTPNVQPGNRIYIDRSTPPSSADSSRLAEARQRRIASLGQHTSAGQSRIGIAAGRLREPEVEQ